MTYVPDHAYYTEGSKYESRCYRNQVLRTDQLRVLAYMMEDGRRPDRVLSIGAGAGFLEMVIALLNIHVIATDPHPAGLELLEESRLIKRYGVQAPLEYDILSAVNAVGIHAPQADTVIFCESIEHITRDELDLAFEVLAGDGPLRVIVANDRPLPIEPHEPDHITRVDEALYVALAGILGGTRADSDPRDLVVDI